MPLNLLRPGSQQSGAYYADAEQQESCLSSARMQRRGGLHCGLNVGLTVRVEDGGRVEHDKKSDKVGKSQPQKGASRHRLELCRCLPWACFRGLSALCSSISSDA
jgi:hypothetical protein